MKAFVTLSLLLLCGCAGMGRVRVPANEVKFKSRFGELTLVHPQNTKMEAVMIQIMENGAVTAQIGSLNTMNSPEVISKSAAGQAAIIKAYGTEMRETFKAGGEAAGKFAGAAAKTAVAP